ncbi:hypothetical protein F220043C3_47790 [Enterocloster asparagiformis]|uniref:Uncharacterized protein n=1 Tax=[Clostridium] asparagiforme DSM 15981 TaxID=518636 RepID=C0D301_9FIRM|nr:hypothetical protein CLOSTASPAR_03641 [[Clostridium] asparagiforme DSM 15981]
MAKARTACKADYELMTSVMILIAGALAFFVALQRGEKKCY